MRLVFLGDISVARPFHIPSSAFPDFRKADVIANLEGPVVSEWGLGLISEHKFPVLYNSLDVLGVLTAFNVRAVCLANNHMYDLPLPAAHTREILARAGVASFGAGANLVEASNPCVIAKGRTTAKLFAFGWDVIECRPATRTREGVNPLTPEHTLNTIRRLRSVDDSSFVIFVMHWNYELEIYPQPAHRQLARALIGKGVDAVIGMHSHVAQGAELVNEKPIVYGLGNWFFPVRQLGHIRLAYPPIASRELALELHIEGRQVQGVRFHWHQFDSNRSLITFEQTEDWDGAILRQLTPYTDMPHGEYVRWFRSNRTRRRGLPVYEDYRSIQRNRIKDRYVKLRQKVVQALVHLRLKGSPRA